jgi:hypothetical protein
MTCPAYETLLRFAAEDLNLEERAGFEAHLETGCDECRRELAAVAELRRLATDERFPAPPSWVLKRAARIPDEADATPWPYRIVSLLIDTLTAPLPIGARSDLASERQLLYSGDDYDIDVHVASAGGGAVRAVRIVGQILPPAEGGSAAGLEVTLAHPDLPPRAAATNELGEFVFEGVVEGDYSLIVEGEFGRLLVESFPARRG